MNMKNRYLNEITFEEAYLAIGRETIDYLNKGDTNSKFSITTKKLLFLLPGLFMPSMMLMSYITKNDRITTTPFSRGLAIITALMFIVVLLMSCFRDNSIFRNYRYKSFLYMSLKILLLSYICGSIGTVDENYNINLLTISIYIPVCLCLYYFVERNMIAEYINATFDKNYKTYKLFSILVRLAGIVVVLGIFIIQLYRLNRWWINKETVNNAITGLGLNTIFTVSAGAIFRIIISLIPTYFSFKPELFIQNKLVMKYLEEFREVYGYYKEEWER